MGNVSSRARAVYQQNTAAVHLDQPESLEDTPVSTARIVAVGSTRAARSGATLQLVNGMIDEELRDDSQEPVMAQQRVIEVQPPRAAPRKQSAQRGPTRVIAYNVRIVARDESLVDDEIPFVDAGEVFEDRTRYAADARAQQPPFAAPRSRAATQPGMRFEAQVQGRHRADESQFVMPNVARNAQYEMPMNVHARAHMPDSAHVAQHARFDSPNAMPGQRSARQAAPYDMPEAQPGMRPRGPMAAAIPMSLFGALENMGAQARRAAARAQSSAAAGSYKQLLDTSDGSLLSSRNLCLAVGAYALVLFLLALFTG